MFLWPAWRDEALGVIVRGATTSREDGNEAHGRLGGGMPMGEGLGARLVRGRRSIRDTSWRRVPPGGTLCATRGLTLRDAGDEVRYRCSTRVRMYCVAVTLV